MADTGRGLLSKAAIIYSCVAENGRIKHEHSLRQGNMKQVAESVLNKVHTLKP